MDKQFHFLVEKGLITEAELEQALEEQIQTGEALCKVLAKLGFLSEQEFLDALSARSGMKTVNLDKTQIDKEALKLIPSSSARLYNVLPIKFENQILWVALADPFNINILEDLRFLCGYPIQGVIASEDKIREKISQVYPQEGESIGQVIDEIKDNLSEIKPKARGLDEVDLKQLSNQAPVIRLLDLVLLEAIRSKASDVHLEPFENELSIRYRIDGVVHEVAQPPKNLSLALTSRIKVLANLDVAESRLPQDGRIMTKISGKDVDLRVSTLPTIFGESVVLRILDRSLLNLSLDQIGLSQALKSDIRRLIKRPNGIILVTGPTGSGKTTTLYSCLREINRIEYKIITTEDPVEYDIPGIIQVSIRPKIDLTFARALRHILRQDPDIIMVGEIRDLETAEIAIHASLTGHLVFSTLHTNDAPSAVARLVDMGVEPYLVSSTLAAVLAQRLVRVICPSCKQPYKATEAELSDLGIEYKGQEITFFRGQGCNECKGTGFKGRTGIFELLLVDEAFRELIIARESSSVLKAKARQTGMKTLKEDGIEKILSGVTTVEEVLRQTQM
jgi:type IV pilus assembly protein PilB